MNAYIFRADLYCGDCAKKLIAKYGTSDNSDDGVCGPYPDGGGESDTPSHCGDCGLFLENALTDDGADYVAHAIDTFKHLGFGDPDTIKAWIERYRDYPEVATEIERS